MIGVGGACPAKKVRARADRWLATAERLNCLSVVVASESGRGQPHSRTLARFSRNASSREGLGVRLPSAASVCGQ